MRRFPTIAVVQWTSTTILLASCLWFGISTVHWPLTGDAALMHYIVFLMDHAFAPYRDIGDMNLPGAYLPNWLVIHSLGPSALAWRLYDYALLLLAGFSMLALIRRSSASWHAGIWAAALLRSFMAVTVSTNQASVTLPWPSCCSLAPLLSSSAHQNPH